MKFTKSIEMKDLISKRHNVLAQMKFRANEQVIVETEAYFQTNTSRKNEEWYQKVEGFNKDNKIELFC